MRELYSHYELRSLAATARRSRQRCAGNRRGLNSEKIDYETVLTWAAFDTWLVKVGTAKLVAFDTETNSLDYMNAEIVGLSLAVAERRRLLTFLSRTTIPAHPISFRETKYSQN